MVLDGFAAYFDAYLENIVREGKSEHTVCGIPARFGRTVCTVGTNAV